jgi:hypothetical protein
MHVAFHDCAHFAAVDELHGFRGGGGVIRCVDNEHFAEPLAAFGSRRFQAHARSDQHRRDEAAAH